MTAANGVTLPQTTLNALKEYLLAGSDPTHERGCLLTRDLEIIPFENSSPTPWVRITMTDEDFAGFLDLLSADAILAWVHSHPMGPPVPSVTDIMHNDFPCDMMIYSVTEDCFKLYSPRWLLKKQKELERQSIKESNKKVYVHE